MKRILISMAALLAVVGCAKQEDLVSANFASGPEFGVAIDATRVAIAEDGEGYTLSWTKGDLISVFYNESGNAQYKFMGETGDVSGKIVAVEAQDAPMLPNFYAIYPYNESNDLNGDVLSFTLPAEQSYEANTFGLGANTMVARTIGEGKYDFAFENICGYICLKVYGGVTVKSIELKGNNEEVIAGAATYDMATDELAITGDGKTITLNCTEAVATGATEAEATAFWFVVPATKFDGGFTVTITDIDGNKMTKKGSKSFTVVANTVYNSTFEFKDDNILFDAKFNLDGTATDAGKYNMTIERKVDGEGNAPYMTTVADAASPTGYAVAFNRPVSTTNGHYTDSYYLVNYADNAEFRAALNDGFTMEVVAKKMVHSYGDWMKPVYSNTFGINYFATAQGNKISINGCDNDEISSWLLDNKEVLTPAGNIVPELEQYYHYMYVYNKEEGKTILYVDGVKIAEPEDVVTSGTRLAIGGYPHAESTQHAFIGAIAVVRILNNPATDEQVKARYEALNIKKPAATNAVLFDAKFSADGGATNVGTESSLVITPKLGTTATTIQRGNTYVATFNNVPKHNQPVTEGYYYIDYSQNESFKNKLKDGFTMEVLSRTTPYAGTYWSKPFAATTFYPHHDWTIEDCKWGFAVNTAENSWGNAGAFGGWFWYDQVSLNYYDHVVLTYDGGGHFSLYVNGKQNGPYLTASAFAPGSAFAIGALPYNDGRAAHPFVGDVAVTRIYDDIMTPEKVSARYNELQPTISTLNTASYDDTLDVLVDVQFNADGSATDKANGYTITKETVGEGGNLTVANGIATFGIDNSNLTYYKIDLAQGDGSLKTSMNNGFTVATIVSSPNDNTEWAAPFGSEGFSMIRLAGWGYKWNSHVFLPGGGWDYTDGVIAPEANKYYHVIFTYNATTQEWMIFRDGVKDMKVSPKLNAIHENSTLVIGARIDGATIHQPWGGNMASLKVYEQAISTEKAAELYEAAKAEISEAQESHENVLFDAKFNADGTVTDAGKFGLNIQKMTHADVEAEYLQVYENNNTYISRSLWQPSDQGNENYAIQKTGYYMVDFSENAEFKAALEDGFSAETVFMIPLSNINRCTVFGTNAWSISKSHNSDKMWASYNVNIASAPYSNFGTVAESGIVSINEFHHAMFVYDAENDKVALYIDGQLAKENTAVATFNIGERLCIGARPMMRTDDNYASAIHHWCGDIASAKIYNKAFTAAEVAHYYNKATIPAYKEVLPQAFFDAKFNMDGSIENQGTLKNIDIKQIVPVAGQTPAVEVLDGAQFGSTNNIINFTQLPSNPGTYAWDAWLTGNQGRPEGAVYYTVGIGDAAGNADFLAKLNSGYITIEFIAAVGTDLEYTTNGIDKYCPFSMEYFNFNYWVTKGKKCQEVNALVPGETDIMTDMPSWTNVNEFHHFIWAANVKEGMSARVLDGVMRFNGDRYDLSQKQTSGLWIGGAYWSASTITRPFNGKIVAIRVYDRALGTAEMGALVKNAKPIIDNLNAHYSAN